MPAAVTIAVCARPLGERRYLVVAWLSVPDGKGTMRTRGLVEIWHGRPREGLALVATQALNELKRPSTVEVVLRRPDDAEPPPPPEATAVLTKAAGRHTVTYTPVREAGRHEILEAAEAFAAARAAGVIAGPDASREPDARAPQSAPPKPSRLFER